MASRTLIRSSTLQEFETAFITCSTQEVPPQRQWLQKLVSLSDHYSPLVHSRFYDAKKGGEVADDGMLWMLSELLVVSTSRCEWVHATKIGKGKTLELRIRLFVAPRTNTQTDSTGLLPGFDALRHTTPTEALDWDTNDAGPDGLDGVRICHQRNIR